MKISEIAEHTDSQHVRPIGPHAPPRDHAPAPHLEVKLPIECYTVDRRPDPYRSPENHRNLLHPRIQPIQVDADVRQGRRHDSTGRLDP